MLNQLKKALNRILKHITTVMIFKELLGHKQYSGYSLDASKPKIVKQAVEMAEAIEKALNENPQ